MATLRLLVREKDRTCFNHSKSEQELGLSFRALELTITDTVAWYRDHDWFENQTLNSRNSTSSTLTAHQNKDVNIL
jgi:dTDP-D-glucose 4,6-dehydratase